MGCAPSTRVAQVDAVTQYDKADRVTGEAGGGGGGGGGRDGGDEYEEWTKEQIDRLSSLRRPTVERLAIEAGTKGLQVSTAATAAAPVPDGDVAARRDKDAEINRQNGDVIMTVRVTVLSGFSDTARDVERG